MSNEEQKLVPRYYDNVINEPNSKKAKFLNLIKTGFVKFNTENTLIFITENQTVRVKPNIKKIHISLTAGGGSGGIGIIKNKISYSGGGGGSGGGGIRLPVTINTNKVIDIKCIIGKGGNIDNRNGGDTIIEIYVDNNLFTTIKCGGGKAGGDGENNEGGEAGLGYGTTEFSFGKKGSIHVNNYNPKAGKGGDSLFNIGGTGYHLNMQDISLIHGQFGSGGGGIVAGIDCIDTSKGGDGFIILEYIS